MKLYFLVVGLLVISLYNVQGASVNNEKLITRHAEDPSAANFGGSSLLKLLTGWLGVGSKLVVWLMKHIHNTGNSNDCGKRYVSNNKRIVNGDDAEYGEWPWQVSLQFDKDGDSSDETYHHCGGVIIDPFWIVTAKHCGEMANYGTIKIYAGINRIGGFYLWVYNETVDRDHEPMDEMNPYMQILEVDKFIPHEDADDFTLDREIMLIKVKNPIQFNKMIQPICLPQKEVNPGTSVWTTGWGTTEFNGKISPEILQEAEVQIINRTTCKEWMTETAKKVYPDLNITITITPNMICTGQDIDGPSPSACHGDSGGALVHDTGNNWELIGLTSWGFECGVGRSPIAYINIYPLVDWINENMLENINV